HYRRTHYCDGGTVARSKLRARRQSCVPPDAVCLAQQQRMVGGAKRNVEYRCFRSAVFPAVYNPEGAHTHRLAVDTAFEWSVWDDTALRRNAVICCSRIVCPICGLSGIDWDADVEPDSPGSRSCSA